MMQLFTIPYFFRGLSTNKYRKVVGWPCVYREIGSKRETLLSLEEEHSLLQKILNETDWVVSDTAAASPDYYVWIASGRAFVSLLTGVHTKIWFRNGSQNEIWNKFKDLRKKETGDPFSKRELEMLDRWNKHVYHRETNFAERLGDLNLSEKNT